MATPHLSYAPRALLLYAGQLQGQTSQEQIIGQERSALVEPIDSESVLLLPDTKAGASLPVPVA